MPIVDFAPPLGLVLRLIELGGTRGCSLASFILAEFHLGWRIVFENLLQKMCTVKSVVINDDMRDSHKAKDTRIQLILILTLAAIVIRLVTWLLKFDSLFFEACLLDLFMEGFNQ